MKIKLIKENIARDRRRAKAAEMLYNFLMDANAIDISPPTQKQSHPMHGTWIFPRIQFEIAEILRKCGYDLSKIKSMPSMIAFNTITKKEAARRGYPGGATAAFQMDGEIPSIIMIMMNAPQNEKENSLKQLIDIRRSEIIHELTHLIDNIILTQNVTSHSKKPKKGWPGFKRGYDYWNDGIEINARWSEILTNLVGIGLIAKNGNPGEFDDRWIHAAKLTMAYDNMKQSKQKKFMKKYMSFTQS